MKTKKNIIFFFCSAELHSEECETWKKPQSRPQLRRPATFQYSIKFGASQHTQKVVIITVLWESQQDFFRLGSFSASFYLCVCVCVRHSWDFVITHRCDIHPKILSDRSVWRIDERQRRNHIYATFNPSELFRWCWRRLAALWQFPLVLIVMNVVDDAYTF